MQQSREMSDELYIPFLDEIAEFTKEQYDFIQKRLEQKKMNYQITFDPNGGDLGRAEIRPIQPLEFMVLVPHIAHILECLHVSNLSKLPFQYAFEFPIHTKREVIIAIDTFRLPPHVSFYEVDGRKFFEMRGASGGIASGLICYLVTHE